MYLVCGILVGPSINKKLHTVRVTIHSGMKQSRARVLRDDFLTAGSNTAIVNKVNDNWSHNGEETK